MLMVFVVVVVVVVVVGDGVVVFLGPEGVVSRGWVTWTQGGRPTERSMNSSMFGGRLRTGVLSTGSASKPE